MALGSKIRRIFLLRRAVHLVWTAAPCWTLAGLLLLFVQGILPLASLYLMKLVVDAVTTSLKAANPNFTDVLWLIIALAGVTLSGTIAGSFAALVSEVQGHLVTDHVQSIIHAKSVELDLAYYENSQYYDTLHRAQKEAPYRPIRIVSGLAGLYEDSLFLANLYEFLDLRPRIVAPLVPREIPRPLQRGIAFNHVRFSYDSCGLSVLDDITLTIRPGEHIALVGANGAGKTTLVKLLCRLYDPTEGSITFDGVDLREMDPAMMRCQISVIFQDYARYYFTARENIWLGNTTLAPDDSKVEAAARDAGADAVIGKLPRGYATPLGRWFDDGQELSIGEWQKIALARAFMRDAPIVILDEPTSALDAAAEFEIFQKFQHLAAGHTTILISHRLSTVRMADCIYVLSGGKITETGSHAELMQRGGEYARLFKMQAEKYR